MIVILGLYSSNQKKGFFGGFLKLPKSLSWLNFDGVLIKELYMKFLKKFKKIWSFFGILENLFCLCAKNSETNFVWCKFFPSKSNRFISVIAVNFFKIDYLPLGRGKTVYAPPSQDSTSRIALCMLLSLLLFDFLWQVGVLVLGLIPWQTAIYIYIYLTCSEVG